MEEREKEQDLYAVLGLKKECTAADLKSAYRKLALRWHPDRCSAAESAENKFQAIQKAYSVLSDESKRSLYDVGWLQEEDDSEDIGDFLGEMLSMMNQISPAECGGESMEDLQRLFFETFQTEANPLFPRGNKNSSPFLNHKFGNSSNLEILQSNSSAEKGA